MGWRKMFTDLIQEGGFTKTELIAKINLIRSLLNTPGRTEITDEDYNEILQAINNSTLAE